MSRISTFETIDAAPAAARPLLEGIKAQGGKVPNMHRLIANSPVALEAYLSFSGALSKGELAPSTRHKIALAVANVNGCDYCDSAHSYISSVMMKAQDDEIALNRTGRSSDPKANAAVAFARKITIARGAVSEDDVKAAKAAGLSDSVLVEIVGQVVANVFTNYINEVFKTEIDFPARKATRVAEHA